MFKQSLIYWVFKGNQGHFDNNRRHAALLSSRC